MSSYNLLPQWTWTDLEEATALLIKVPDLDLARLHLLRGLKEDAQQMSPVELLREVLAVALLLQPPGMATNHPQQAPLPA